MGLSSTVDSGRINNRSHVRHFHALIRKSITIFLSLFLALFPCFVYAAFDVVPQQPSWLPDDLYKVRSAQLNYQANSASVNAYRAYKATVNGTAVYAESSVIRTVTAAEVGSVMNKRISKAALGGGALFGTVAVSALLEGIGWVMDQGSYVKFKTPDGKVPDNGNYKYYGSCSVMPSACSSSTAVDINTFIPLAVSGLPSTRAPWTFSRTSASVNPVYQIYFKDNANTESSTSITNVVAPHDPLAPQRVSITDAQVAAVVSHSGYVDPVDSSKNATINTGNPDLSIYEAASTQLDGETDNPIVNDINTSLDAAPKITTKSGTDGTTETETKDPDGITLSTSTSNFKLPAFCDWASTLCDHISWIEEPPKPSTPEPVDKEDISADIPANPTINFNAQCPVPVTFTFDFPFKTFAWDFEWTNLCNSLVTMKPWVLGIANIMAVFILLNARKEI